MQNDVLLVPHFADEADEAQWWFDNQEKIAAAWDAAAANGTLRKGNLQERLARLRRTQSVMLPTEGAAPTNIITLSAADEQAARQAAERAGETYEMFVRRVVHEALQLEQSA